MQLAQAIAEFMSGYFSTHERSQKTRAAYRLDLEQFKTFAEEELNLVSLKSSLIEDWAAHLRKEEYSPASMRRKLVVLKVFCSYWVRKGVLTESPFWRVKLSLGRIEQLPRALTEGEIKELLAHAGRHHTAALAPRKGSVLARSPSARRSSREYRAL